MPKSLHSLIRSKNTLALSAEIPYILPHGLIETKHYRNSLSENLISFEHSQEFGYVIAENPLAGDVIQGTGGFRKIRFAGHNKGKSGGFRIIYLYSGEGIPILLLDIYGKGQKSNISNAEKNELKQLAMIFVNEYRNSMKEKGNINDKSRTTSH